MSQSSFQKNVFALPNEVKTPFTYFQTIATDEINRLIVDPTNLYSPQTTGFSINTTIAAVEHFLAVLQFMGVFEFPVTEDWLLSHEITLPHDCRNHAMKSRQDAMSFHLFQWQPGSRRELWSFLQDPPTVWHVAQAVSQKSTFKQSVDEIMVSSKVTRAGNLRQFIWNKPCFGFKIYSWANTTGIIHDVLPWCCSP